MTQADDHHGWGIGWGMTFTGNPLQADSSFSAAVDLQEPLTSPLSEPVETASGGFDALVALNSSQAMGASEQLSDLDAAISALGGVSNQANPPDNLTGFPEASNPPLLDAAIGEDGFLTFELHPEQQRQVLEDRPFSLDLRSLLRDGDSLANLKIIDQANGTSVDWLMYEQRLPDATLAESLVIEGLFQETEGEMVKVDVVVTDTRHDGRGLIGLELDLLWDTDAMELTQVSLTPSLPLFRETGNLDAATGSLRSLVAASLPSSGNGEALGDSWRESFAQLSFRRLGETTGGGELMIIPRNYPARGNNSITAGEIVVVDRRSQEIPVLFGQAGQDAVGEHRLLLEGIDLSGRQWQQTLVLNVLNVNDAPIALPLEPISVLEDSAIEINLAEAFEDEDLSVGDELRYRLSEGSPAWLMLDADNGLLSGKPGNQDVGQWRVGIEASDLSGAVAQQTLELVVVNTNDAPLWEGRSLQEIWVRENRPFEIRLPERSIIDIDAGDRLHYSLDFHEAPQLASLLTVDTESGMISGVIPSGRTGLLNVKLIATDLAGASTSVPLQLRVVDKDFNRRPYRVDSKPETISIKEGKEFRLEVNDLFIDDDIIIGDHLRFEVEAPKWLQFDPKSNSLFASTDNNSVGQHTIRLKAIDQAGEVAEALFRMEVENTNQTPTNLDGFFDERRIRINDDLRINVNELFEDVDRIHGDDLSLNLELGRKSNIKFNSTTGELVFTPGEEDIGLHRLFLSAKDRSGASSRYQLNLNVVTEEQSSGIEQAINEQDLLVIQPSFYLKTSGERIQPEHLGTLPAGTQVSMRVELTDQRQTSTKKGVIGLDLDLRWTGLKLKQPVDQNLDESISTLFPLLRQVDESHLNENRLRFSAASLPELGMGEALGDQRAETFVALDFEITDPTGPIRLDLILNEESAGGLGVGLADGSSVGKQLEIKSLSHQTLIDQLMRKGQKSTTVVRLRDLDGVLGDSGKASRRPGEAVTTATPLMSPTTNGPEPRPTGFQSLNGGRLRRDLGVGIQLPVQPAATSARLLNTEDSYTTEGPSGGAGAGHRRLGKASDPEGQGDRGEDEEDKQDRSGKQAPDDFSRRLRYLLESFQHPASLAGLVMTMMTMPGCGERGLRSLLVQSKLGKAIQLQRRNPELKAAWHLRLRPPSGSPVHLELLIEHGHINLHEVHSHEPQSLHVTRALDQQASLWRVISGCSNPGTLLADVNHKLERVLLQQDEDLNWSSWLDQLAETSLPSANRDNRLLIKQLQQSLLLAQGVDQAMGDALMVSELLNCQVQIGLMLQRP